jgi:hypothetical protein
MDDSDSNSVMSGWVERRPNLSVNSAKYISVSSLDLLLFADRVLHFTHATNTSSVSRPPPPATYALTQLLAIVMLVG